MRLLHAQFTFAPVGQGCFYYGHLVSGSGICSVVYDCGTKSRDNGTLKTYIDAYVENCGTNPDTLFISHLDADHVNKLPLLLNKLRDAGKMFRRVILPYLTPAERLVLQAKYLHEDDGGDDGLPGGEPPGDEPAADDGGNRDGTDYLRLVADPPVFFREYKIPEIILVRGNDDNEPGEYNAFGPNNPLGSGEFNPEQMELRISEQRISEELKKEYSNTDESLNAENIKMADTYCTGVAAGIWKFVVFNQVQKPPAIQRFINEFLNCFDEANRIKLFSRKSKLTRLEEKIIAHKNEHSGTAGPNQLQMQFNLLEKYAKSKPIDSVFLQELLRTDQRENGLLILIRRVFKKHFKDFNSTGNVLVHFPVACKNASVFPAALHGSYGKLFGKIWPFHLPEFPEIIQACFDRNLFIRHRYFGEQYGRWLQKTNSENEHDHLPVTVLTGDASLDNTRSNRLRAPMKAINWPADIKQEILPLTLVFQVPHHGSHHNWSSKVFQALFMAGRSNVQLWPVVNFGLGNSHGHPKQEVLDDLVNLIPVSYTIPNHQYQEFGYYGAFRF